MNGTIIALCGSVVQEGESVDISTVDELPLKSLHLSEVFPPYLSHMMHRHVLAEQAHQCPMRLEAWVTHHLVATPELHHARNQHLQDV